MVKSSFLAVIGAFPGITVAAAYSEWDSYLNSSLVNDASATTSSSSSSELSEISSSSSIVDPCSTWSADCENYCYAAATFADSVKVNGTYDADTLCVSKFYGKVLYCMMCNWAPWYKYQDSLDPAVTVCQLYPYGPETTECQTTSTRTALATSTHDLNNDPDYVCDDATLECHAYCGGAARNARTCGNGVTYNGPFNYTCLCEQGDEFMDLIYECYACGWAIWNDYGQYITSAVSFCSLTQTEPGSDKCKPSETSEITSTSSASSAESFIITSSSAVKTSVVITSSTELSSAVDSSAESLISLSSSITKVLSSDLTETLSNSSESSNASATWTSHSSVDRSSSTASPESSEPSDNLNVTGDLESDGPTWRLTVAGTLGPWTELVLNVGTDGHFEYLNAEVLINGEVTSEAEIIIIANGIIVTLYAPIGISDVVIINYAGGNVDTSVSSITSSGAVFITGPDVRLIKRTTKTYFFSSTLTVNTTYHYSGSSDSSSSAASLSAGSSAGSTSRFSVHTSDSSSGSTSDQLSSYFSRELSNPSTNSFPHITSVDTSPSTNLTSTDLTSTDSSSATTVVTVCTTYVPLSSSDSDTGTVTSTLHSGDTLFTTYCPLTTTNSLGSTIKPATTVITLTSCSVNKCSESIVTTGVTTITSINPNKSSTHADAGTRGSTGNHDDNTTFNTEITINTNTKGVYNTSSTTFKNAYTIKDVNSNERSSGTASGSSTAVDVITVEGVAHRLAIGSKFVAIIFSVLFI